MAELYKFTPVLEKPENLQKFLVGRESLLKRLLQAIADAHKSLQHFLLIGPRGIGKTHLLLLLYYSVKGTITWDTYFQSLPKCWEPILFSEEHYGIGSLTELLLEILRQLREQQPNQKRERLLAHIQDVPRPGEAEREMILEYLLQRKSETGKRILLLLDNLQMILGNFSEEDQSRLRSILMSADLFMIVGSAPTLFESVLNYEAPFYNFFEIIWLKEISLEEVEALLKKRLEHDKRTDILKRFKEYRPRIRAVVHLTGGNPRLILSLYQIFTEGEVVEVERALLRLLDELTPYFQDRMGQLSVQQRKIIEAMALADGPATPTEIAQAAHLEVNVVTTQLKRLEGMGYVRSHKEKGKREALYDISDQLFRLWRQMRVEAGRRRLGFIVSFLKIWFTEEEITEIVSKSLGELVAQLEQAKYEQAKEIIDKLYYYREAAPAALQLRIGFGRVFGLIDTGNLAEAERDLQKLQGYAQTEEEKELLSNAWNNLGVAYSKRGEHEQAVEAYRKALEIKPDDHGAWNNLGNVYSERGEHEQAIAAYRRAIEIVEETPFPDAALRLLVLHLKLSQEEARQGDEEQAFEHYRKALHYLAQGASPDQAQDSLILLLYFKALLSARTLRFAEKALDLLEAQGQEWVALMHPYRAALNYLKTKDKSILNRLFPEIRQIVEEMVAHVEREASQKPRGLNSPVATEHKRRPK